MTYRIIFLLLLSFRAYTLLGSALPQLEPKAKGALVVTDIEKLLIYIGEDMLGIEDSAVAQIELKALWEKKRKSIKTEGKETFNSSRIPTLFKALQAWSSSYLGSDNLPDNLDNFTKNKLDWCDDWAENKPTDKPCEGIGISNFNDFRYHLIYTFVAEQINSLIVERSRDEKVLPPAPSSIDSLRNELADLKEALGERDFIVNGLLGISLILVMVSLLYVVLNRMKINKRTRRATNAQGVSLAPQSPINTNPGTTVVSWEEFDKIKRRVYALEQKRSVDTDSSGGEQSPRNSHADRNTGNEVVAPKRQPIFKITYFIEQPNKLGIINKTHASETKKSYFVIRLEDENSQVGQIVLVDNVQKRKRMFNSPDTYLPSNICKKQYAGQIDYSSKVHIEPGEVQKLPSGTWKVSKPMVVKTH